LHLLKPFLRVRGTHSIVRLSSEQTEISKMKIILKPYRHLLSLLAVILFAVSLAMLGVSASACAVFVGCWQLSQIAMSKRRAMCYTTVLSPEQIDEFQDILKQAQAEFPRLKGFSERLVQVEKTNDELRAQVNRMKKASLAGMGHTGVRWIGNKPFVTDDCATALTSVFVLDCAKLKGAMDSLVPDASARERVISLAAQTIGMETRTALGTTEIPLPTIYVPQIIELVFAYGQARQFATVFPLGSGTVKLPRLKAGEDDFGYMGAGTAGMSQPVGEKRVTAELVTFTANKFGGLIRIPYELEEDTFIPIGQFLARYIARQLAKGEDKTMFLADGTASYANQTGIGPYCSTNTDYLYQLSAVKTKVSDITLDDLRNMRGQVNGAVLANMAANGQTSAAYYMHPSMEPLLRSFNKYPNFVVFTNENGKPMFDGWPVHWIGVGAINNQKAAAAQYAVFFGDLSYWYLGERGAIRVEVSKEVFFATDELAMRALERIDVEAMAIDAMVTLQLGAGS
jgi:HK97 family phage major capsid protein